MRILSFVTLFDLNELDQLISVPFLHSYPKFVYGTNSQFRFSL